MTDEAGRGADGAPQYPYAPPESPYPPPPSPYPPSAQAWSPPGPAAGQASGQATGPHPLAVAALVTGIVGLVPVSVACAAVALSRLRGSSRSGRAQAVGGLLASVLWVLVSVAVAAVLIVRASSGAAPPDTSAAGGGQAGAGAPTSASSSGPSSGSAGSSPAPRQLIPSIQAPRFDAAIRLSRGDCIVELPTSGEIDGIVLTECTRPHQAQVGATFSPAGSSYPGLDRLGSIARSQGPVRLGKALRAGAPPLIWRMLIPEKSEWDGGDHSIKCLFQAEKGRLLSSSVIK
jgi:hypothetical protein